MTSFKGLKMHKETGKKEIHLNNYNKTMTIHLVLWIKLKIPPNPHAFGR